MSITTILFDLDDTLHDDIAAFRMASDEISARVAQHYPVAPSALSAAFQLETESFWRTYNPALLDPNKDPRSIMWMRALKRFGIESVSVADELAQRFETARAQYYRLFPGTTAALAELRARGFTLGMLTNGLRSTHRAKLQLLGIEEYFHGVFLSDDLGVSKPDPAAFRMACEQLGSAPQQTVMVGDRYDKDIAGALDVGLLTIWVNPQLLDAPENTRAPHATVSSVAEVPDTIESLMGLKAQRTTTEGEIRL